MALYAAVLHLYRQRQLVLSGRLRTNFAVAILFTLAALAPRVNAELGFQAWSVDNGLPENEIRGITQTQDGYLWIATMDGLARFDGVRFVVFNKSNTPAIRSNRFTSIERSQKGELWIVYETGGLLRYHQGHFQSYDTKDGIPGNNVSTVTTDASGRVWLLSSGKIAEWNPGSDRFERSTNLNDRVYGPLVWENSGFVAYDREKVYCFSKGRMNKYFLPERLRGKVILRVGLDQARIAWLLMSQGEIVRLAASEKSGGDELPHMAEYDHRGPEGKVWQFHLATNLTRTIDAVSAGERFGIDFRYAYPDDQGNLWLATEEGLYRLHDKIITAYSIEQGLQDRDIYPVFQDAVGAVWMGAWHKGLSRFSNGRFENFTVADGLPYSLVTSLFQTREGRLWIGAHGGLTTYQRGHFSMDKVPHVPGEVVQAIFQDRTGAIWFGTRSGASRWKDDVLQTIMGEGDAAPRDVHVIDQTSDGDIWFGGVNGLTQLHQGKMRHWTESEGLGSNNVWSLFADPDGTLWIGTFDGGLVRLKDQTITLYTTENGLFSNGVFQILDDRLGYLWMSCDHGIYRVSKKGLVDFAEHKRTSILSLPFGKADGLLTLESNGGVSPSGIRASDGRLWFPTRDGVAVVNPAKVQVEAQLPKVIIETASLDQVPLPTDTPITVPPAKYNLQILYTAPDFVRPEQLRFRYKLQNLDDQWNDVGFRRSASYTHLPPGHYQFIVSAQSENGNWSPPSKPLSIDVLAPFYRTEWFEILLLGAASLVIVSGWRHRMRGLKAKHALQADFLQQLITSQEDERERIARELHDSLGQRLVVIISTARLAVRSMNSGTKSAESVLEEISLEAAAGLEDTRLIAYDLRPAHLDRLGLTQSIEYLVQKTANASNMRIAIELDDVDSLIPRDHWINLYRIVQEGLGNLMKYSLASQSSVSLRHSANKAVRDDGVGFEMNGNLNKTGRIGLGLRGMAERASLIGANLQIRSAPSQGTVISVEMVIEPESPETSNVSR